MDQLREKTQLYWTHTGQMPMAGTKEQILKSEQPLRTGNATPTEVLPTFHSLLCFTNPLIHTVGKNSCEWNGVLKRNVI